MYLPMKEECVHHWLELCTHSFLLRRTNQPSIRVKWRLARVPCTKISDRRRRQGHRLSVQEHGCPEVSGQYGETGLQKGRCMRLNLVWAKPELDNYPQRWKRNDMGLPIKWKLRQCSAHLVRRGQLQKVKGTSYRMSSWKTTKLSLGSVSGITRTRKEGTGQGIYAMSSFSDSFALADICILRLGDEFGVRCWRSTFQNG